MSRWVLKATGEEVAAYGGFDIIYADCPQSYGVAGGRGAADKHYPTMSLAELCLLPVEDLASENSVLFTWATWPTLPDAFAIMKAWGFRYYNAAFIWTKVNPIAGTPFVGLGHMTRGNSEPCLLGVRGKPKRVDAAVQQIILGEGLIASPIGKHSAKPAEARDRIIRLMGDVPAIELFARQQHPGWENFGNQVDSSVILEN